MEMPCLASEKAQCHKEQLLIAALLHAPLMLLLPAPVPSGTWESFSAAREESVEMQENER